MNQGQCYWSHPYWVLECDEWMVQRELKKGERRLLSKATYAGFKPTIFFVAKTTIIRTNSLKNCSPFDQFRTKSVLNTILFSEFWNTSTLCIIRRQRSLAWGLKLLSYKKNRICLIVRCLTTLTTRYRDNTGILYSRCYSTGASYCIYLYSSKKASWKPLKRASMSFISSGCGRIVVLKKNIILRQKII